LGLRGTRQQRSRENYIMKSLMIFTRHLIMCGDQIEKNESVGHVARMGERRVLYRVLVGKPK
jgi:hypothetical protein